MKDYIRKLRSTVGRQKLIIVGGRAIVENEHGEILFHKRTDFDDTWSLPGGQTELNESVEDTIIREVKEETGLDVLKYDVIGIASDPKFESIVYPNGDQAQLVAVVFHIREYAGALSSNSEEVDDIRFFPIRHLPNLRPNEHRSIKQFTHYRKDGIFKMH